VIVEGKTIKFAISMKPGDFFGVRAYILEGPRRLEVTREWVKGGQTLCADVRASTFW
jgi:hypothetical protein